MNKKQLLERIFYYDFLDGMLIGSEDPALFGNPLTIAKQMVSRYKIKHIITLTASYDGYEINGCNRYHVPVINIPSFSQMDNISLIIDNALEKNEAVWVHCGRGIDRTGCVIGAYLSSRGHSPDAVIRSLFLRFSTRINCLKLEELWKDKSDFIYAYLQIKK